MGIRGLLIAAAVAALAPGVASAQGRQLPMIGEGSSAVPPPRAAVIVAPTTADGGKSLSQKTGDVASVGIGISKLGSDAAEAAKGVSPAAISPLSLDTLRSTRGAALGDPGDFKALGVGANILGMGANIGVMADKCSGATYNGSECAQAGLNATSNFMSATGTAAGVKGFGKVGDAVQLGADVVGLHRNCLSDQAEAGQCVLSSFDTTMSLGALTVPGGEQVNTAYSIGKVIAPALVDAASYGLYNKPLYEAYYDLLRAEQEMNAISDATSQAAVDSHRARLRARYQDAKANFEAKQAAYDAEQRRIEAERQAQIAAQQQAAMQAQASQQFVNDLVGLQRVYLGQTVGPAAPTTPGCTATPEICDDLRNGWPGGRPVSVLQGQPMPAPAKSAPPPSSSGGCSLTAEDRAKGRVCTAN